jgi:hypothetical protein
VPEEITTMFQDRTKTPSPVASATERLVGSLLLGSAIFLAGVMVGMDYKADLVPAPTPAAPLPAPTPLVPVPAPY